MAIEGRENPPEPVTSASVPGSRQQESFTMRTLSLAFFALSATLTPTLDAAVLNVPSQFGSIQAALDAAAPGDTVLVKAGTYFENLKLSTDHVHLKGKGKVIVDALAGGLAHGAALIIGPTATGARASGLTLRHARNDIGLGYGVLNVASEVVLTKLTIQACQVAGIHTDADDVTIRQCVVEGCNGGIEAYGMDQTVEQCVVRSDGVRGIRVLQKYATVRNNRVEDIEDGPGIAIEADFVTLSNNRIARIFDGSGLLLSGGTIVATGNVLTAIGNDNRAIQLMGSYCELRKNRVTRCVASGLYITSGAKESIVEKNVFERCGTENEPTIWVSGLYSHLNANTVRFADGDGIYIDANGATFDGNRVQDGSNDGIFVAPLATNTELRKNIVRNNLGEGFDIASSPAVFKGNVALGNRIDLGFSVWFDTSGNVIGTFNAPDVP
jgi:hypothetical protein